jgi:cytochrome c oxidase subunit II
MLVAGACYALVTVDTNFGPILCFERQTKEGTTMFGGRWSPGTAIAIGLIFIVGLVCLIASQNVLQLPEAITVQGDRIKNLYTATLAICLIVYVLVTGGIIWAIFQFKRKSPDEIPAQIHGSSKLETIWTAIPIMILVGLFIPAMILVLDLKTPPDDPFVTVDAVGHQWWWEFAYENGIKVQSLPPNYDDLDPPRLVVPVGQTVRVVVKSTDVIHSFSAPNLLYKVQAIPGNINEMHFKAEKTGEFLGQCYQFCGLRHSDMRWVLDVRSEADYNRWVSETRRAQGLTGDPTESASTTAPAGNSRSE